MALKKIAFELIVEEENIESQPYRIMREIREAYHEETREARIALAWRKGFKPDPEGHLVLGKCVKASDLQRELVDLDFVILLNKEVWEDQQFTVEMKKALIDHELTHAARAYDGEGEPVIDVKQRPVWRIRRHDLEEFFDIARRHGCWKRDLQLFAEAILKKKNPIFPELEPEAKPPERVEIDMSVANIEDFFGKNSVDAMTAEDAGNSAIVDDDEEEEEKDEAAVFSDTNPAAAMEAIKPEHDAAWGEALVAAEPKRGRGRPKGSTKKTDEGDEPF